MLKQDLLSPYFMHDDTPWRRLVSGEVGSVSVALQSGNGWTLSLAILSLITTYEMHWVSWHWLSHLDPESGFSHLARPHSSRTPCGLAACLWIAVSVSLVWGLSLTVSYWLLGKWVKLWPVTERHADHRHRRTVDPHGLQLSWEAVSSSPGSLLVFSVTLKWEWHWFPGSVAQCFWGHSKNTLCHWVNHCQKWNWLDQVCTFENLHKKPGKGIFQDPGHGLAGKRTWETGSWNPHGRWKE